MRKHLQYIATIILLYTTGYVSAQSSAYFQYDSDARQIYEDILNLRLETANQKLEILITGDTDNLAYLHLDSYKNFFHLFITEDERLLKASQKQQEKYRKRLRKELDDNDPYKRFAEAEMLLHSAIIRSKFNQLLRSGRELLKAYDLLKENEALFPDFIYNKKSLSVIHSLAETVSLPGMVKNLFGIEGSIEQGLKEIESVIEYSHLHEDFIFAEEADAIYLYILMYQANLPQKAINYIPDSRLNPKASPMATFLVSKMYQRSGENDKALNILTQRPASPEQMPFHYLDLMEGTCRMRQLDSACTEYLENYISQFKGRHFIKEAYQKLAWAELIFHDNLLGYKYYLSQAKAQGHDLVDDDKQALRESQSLIIPDPVLLKARLLSDGGYYEKAYSLLAQKAYLYTDQSHKALEFQYRMGRISHALKNYPDALTYYESTITQGKDLPYYYACNAALQAGIIQESLGKYDDASYYFKQCLDIKPEEYRSSLHQKAKTALLRISSLNK